MNWNGKRHFLNQHNELAQTGYENPHPTQILQNNKKKNPRTTPFEQLIFLVGEWMIPMCMVLCVL